MATLQVFIGSMLFFTLAMAGLGMGFLLQRRVLKKRCGDCECVPHAGEAGGVCTGQPR